MPPPVPMYITHIPQERPVLKSASFMAMVFCVLVVDGRPRLLAKFGP